MPEFRRDHTLLWFPRNWSHYCIL